MIMILKVVEYRGKTSYMVLVEILGNPPIYDLAEELIGEKEKCMFLVETISYALKMRTQIPNNKTIIIFVKHSNI